MGNSVRIHFRLQQDDDNYPPIAVETVWAKPSAHLDEYMLDNVPFFTRDATIGDTVLVRKEDGNLWFTSMVDRSGNSLIRVVFFDRSCVTEVSSRLESLGCELEYLRDYNLLAVSIPQSIPLAQVQSYLESVVTDGKIDYEEAILRQ